VTVNILTPIVPPSAFLPVQFARACVLLFWFFVGPEAWQFDPSPSASQVQCPSLLSVRSRVVLPCLGIKHSLLLLGSLFWKIAVSTFASFSFGSSSPPFFSDHLCLLSFSDHLSCFPLGFVDENSSW
jgi:hypothetical protein